MKGIAKGFRNIFICLIILLIVVCIALVNIKRVKSNYTNLHLRVQKLEAVIEIVE